LSIGVQTIDRSPRLRPHFHTPQSIIRGEKFGLILKCGYSISGLALDPAALSIIASGSFVIRPDQEKSRSLD
jgi:hypothetical protein